MHRLDQESLRLIEDAQEGQRLKVTFDQYGVERVSEGWFQEWIKEGGVYFIVMTGHHKAKFKINRKHVMKIREY